MEISQHFWATSSTVADAICDQWQTCVLLTNGRLRETKGISYGTRLLVDN